MSRRTTAVVMAVCALTAGLSLGAATTASAASPSPSSDITAGAVVGILAGVSAGTGVGTSSTTATAPTRFPVTTTAPTIRTTTGTTSSPTTTTPTTTTASAATAMKPFAAGNNTRGFATLRSFASATAVGVTSGVVDVPWSAIEPAQGAYTTAPIDAELATARANGIAVRLRVIAGTQAPTYAKQIGGAPIPFYDHQARAATTIGRFWTTAYQARWQALQRYLAAKYDGDRLVREVNIAGTGAISAEVMLTMGNDTIPGSTITNNSRLLAAGATETARRAALMNDITFMQNTWTHTHTTLFCHPYVSLAPSPKVDLTTTEQIVEAAYRSKPGATVFGHTGAAESTFRGTTHGTVLDMYLFFVAHHYPYMAQTQTYGGGAKNDGVGDLGYVVSWLATHGAYSTELPKGWENDAATLRILPGTTRRMIASATSGAGTATP